MEDLQEDLINVEQAGTLDGLFYERVRRSPELTAYQDFDRQSDELAGQYLGAMWLNRWRAGGRRSRQKHLEMGTRAAISPAQRS